MRRSTGIVDSTHDADAVETRAMSSYVLCEGRKILMFPKTKQQQIKEIKQKTISRTLYKIHIFFFARQW